MKKYQAWGYKENASTCESCIIEISANNLKDAKEKYNDLNIVLTSRIYRK